MRKTDLDELINVEADKMTVSVKELTNKDDRTLLWGYTVDRYSHHVYLKDGEIHIVVWTGGNVPGEDRYDKTITGFNLIRHVSGDIIDIEDSGIVPSKRLYPEACDAEFCKLLKIKGVSLPFTTWNDERPDRQFHGVVL